MLVYASIAGGGMGGLATLLLLRYVDNPIVGWLLGPRLPAPASNSSLKNQDRQAVAANLAQHAEAVQQKLGEFADQLSGGDPVLRERLRSVERGVGSW